MPAHVPTDSLASVVRLRLTSVQTIPASEACALTSSSGEPQITSKLPLPDPNASLSRYECVCEPGWTGDECDINIEDCASNPCQNKGECLDEVSNTAQLVQNLTCMPRLMATPVCVSLASPEPIANTNVTSALTNHARMVAPVSPQLTALSAPAGRALLVRLLARWRRTSAAPGPAIHLELLSALIWTTDLSANAETVTRVNVARPI